ncbi:hypothetical protein Tco_0483768 [Tanacetum coccineum]
MCGEGIYTYIRWTWALVPWAFHGPWTSYLCDYSGDEVVVLVGVTVVEGDSGEGVAVTRWYWWGDDGGGGDDEVKMMMAETMGWCGAAGGGGGSGGRNPAGIWPEKRWRRQKIR